MKFSAIFSLSVGTLMLAQWIFFLSTGQVPEFQTEPARIALHLAAEACTALGLLASGMGILLSRTWAARANLIFTGMLAYSVIASPGYFAQQGQWGLVAMFSALLLLSIVSIVRVSRHLRNTASA